MECVTALDPLLDTFGIGLKRLVEFLDLVLHAKDRRVQIVEQSDLEFLLFNELSEGFGLSEKLVTHGGVFVFFVGAL